MTVRRRERALPTERILINGVMAETLPEYLRPGLRAVFVGLNPSPVSVAAGHYYQGTLGRRFWGRVRNHGLIPWDRVGAEDRYAFEIGFGFTDLVRRPTARATGLCREEIRSSAVDLVRRLQTIGDRPLIIFVFAAAWQAASPRLHELGFKTFKFPGPYAATAVVEADMRRLRSALGMHDNAPF